jgi:hypothetical protein
MIAVFCASSGDRSSRRVDELSALNEAEPLALLHILLALPALADRCATFEIPVVGLLTGCPSIRRVIPQLAPVR